MQKKEFIRQLNELVPRPDPVTTEALYRFDRECAETEYIDMAIPYILCAIFVLTISGIGMNTTRRLADTGHEKRDMFLQMLLNVLVAAFAVTFWLLLQYGANWIIGTGYCPLPQMTNNGGAGTSVGSLDFSFGFPLILGFTAVINTYFYRKTGNIWLGTFIGAILAGLTGAITYTIAI